MHVFTTSFKSQARSLIVRFLSVTVLAVTTLTLGLSLPGGAAKENPWSPSIVTRAGSSNVLYVLWETNSCTLRRCLRLERSTNGGRTFTSVSVPPVTPVLGTNVSPISQLYFANPMDGYAIESGSSGSKWIVSALFVTFDGGQSWRSDQIVPHSKVFSITSSAHYFYAITDQCPTKGTQCHQIQLSRSTLSASTWTSVSLPKQLGRYWLGNIDVAAFGPKVWLTTENQTSSPFSPFLATSNNEGRTFERRYSS